MAVSKTLRINKVLKELNISLDRAVEHLASKGHEIEARPTTKITQEEYEILLDGFQTDRSKKVASKEVSEEIKREKEEIRLALEKEKERLEPKVIKAKAEKIGFKEVGKIDLKPKKKEEPAPTPTKEPEKQQPKEEKKVEQPQPTEKKEERVVLKGLKIVGKQEIPEKKKAKETKKESSKPKKETPKAKEEPVKKVQKEKQPEPKVEIEEPETVETAYQKLDGPKLTGEKIDLSQFKKPAKSKKKKDDKKAGSSTDKKKRKRIRKPVNSRNEGGNKRDFSRGNRGRAKIVKEEPSEEEVQKQVRETLEKLQGKSKKGKGARYRREKRDQHRQQVEKDLAKQEAESKVLKITEFISANELASLMNVPITNIISTCMSLGLMITMNHRLDAETISLVADEFGYTVNFVSAESDEIEDEVEDNPEDLEERAPIVTVMGHVDHGKTSLLDYIRQENVIAGESGGITQHIGAYGVQLKSGQKIAFLDTPGHEAFTAMRARGAQLTDIVVIVIAADDDVMPQTKEAISHAQAAGVPIVFAINKIDKPTANPDKIKEQLANMNLLVEDWGGKIQSHDISAKTGLGVDELLEKVLLEAELLELKANPNKLANGAIVEAQLDKGRGYISTILVQEGTLKIGDYMLAGKHSGKVKAMFNERGKRLKQAGPSTPVSILGLDGAPQAGDKFKIFEDEREAKQIATKRSQLQREMSVRTQQHITLDEIGRRIALGDFKELKIILKGDVDGSVEALTDSFQKLSTEEIQVNIIHKGVGAITESDVLLASASDAIIIGFNVRPAGNARMLADNEEIDIRTYSIIYNAINDLKDAMEGMLSPEMKEEVTGTAEIRATYKISKVGTIAGCMVLTGKIFRNSMIRLIRDNVVIYTGELASLKRFKDDAKEVAKGYDCGMQVKNYNDIQENDIIEAYHEVEVKKKLK
ncbi:MAG: translation initiation factor IF-2 [Flavobacteriaceae bacterium]|nr:translation initiation factor IF-2 [Flavobacteriaceae bacterium]